MTAEPADQDRLRQVTTPIVTYTTAGGRAVKRPDYAVISEGPPKAALLWRQDNGTVDRKIIVPLERIISIEWDRTKTDPDR